MSIEDQLYGLAFASETDQDLCMAVTCARRWSEVEDALAESCTAADTEIKRVRWEHQITGVTYAGLGVTGATAHVKIVGSAGGVILEGWWTDSTGTSLDAAALLTLLGSTNSSTPPVTAVSDLNGGAAAGANYYLAPGFTVTAASGFTFTVEYNGDAAYSQGGLARVVPATQLTNGAATVGTISNIQHSNPSGSGHVDLFINVRVSNGHPKALDTILRVRFTVAYVAHEPSALNTWNTRASTAAAGVIQSGVVGDAPEGGKQQHEDTTVVAP